MTINKLLVTGAAGYIGSTFTFEAIKKGFKVIGIDNFSNSNNKIINYFLRKYPNQFNFFQIDIRNKDEINSLLEKNNDLFCLMHFAALKSIPESELNPDLYWENNVSGTKNLIESMQLNDIKNIIFSSSAALYGEQKIQPIKENVLPIPKSNYALTKLESEKLLKKFASEKILRAISLRYFNPVASHSDHIIFEDYNNSSNLMSILLKVASNKLKSLEIYGNDYPTRDGTAERDFIHMQDLVDGHFAALNIIQSIEKFIEINLGTGSSVSVLELVNAFKKVNDLDFKVNFTSRREGDISMNFADVSKAKKVLGWESSYNLNEMCKDSWKVIQNEFK